jgi:putative transposase
MLVCSAADAASRESQARFRRRACGLSDNADVNAARVILARALERTAGRPSVAAGVVREPLEIAPR